MFEPETSLQGIARGGAYMGQVWFDNGYAASIRLEPTDWTDGEPRYEVAVVVGTPDSWTLHYGTPITDDVIRYATGVELLEILQQIRNL